MRAILTALLLTFASQAGAECGNLCDQNWWKTATAADVQAELDAGADVMARNEYGTTPLHWAAGYSTLANIKALIAAGADVMARDNYGYTTLLWAAKGANEDVVRFLISSGVGIDARSLGGDTPLLAAAGSIFGPVKDILELLLYVGADIEKRNLEGETALSLASGSAARAAFGGRWCKLPKPSCTPSDVGLDRLITPTQSTVLVLIDAGSDVHVRNFYGQTPLLKAARHGNPAIVKALIDAGSDVNVREHATNEEFTPLLYTMKYNDNYKDEIVELLIQGGADLTAKSITGIGVEDLIHLLKPKTSWAVLEAMGRCSKLCSKAWWMSASEPDLWVELKENAVTKLAKKDRIIVWDLAQISPLRLTKAYWALNDARYN